MSEQPPSTQFTSRMNAKKLFSKGERLSFLLVHTPPSSLSHIPTSSELMDMAVVVADVRGPMSA